MVLTRRTGALYHSVFRNLRDHLLEGDVLVVNDSKVFPARLLGSKATGGQVDLLLLQPCHGETASSAWPDTETSQSPEWDCLIRSSGRPKKGQLLAFPQGLHGEVVCHAEGGIWKVRFNRRGKDLLEHLEQYGLTPLPPYVKRSQSGSREEVRAEDRRRYQTVFARETGSVAAPTAGLHFSESLCRSLEEGGISFCPITLHVGQATFLPIRTTDIRNHRMWPERYRLSQENAEKMRTAKREGRRLVAVGTTVVRCLESLVLERGGIEAGQGWASLYIIPGHRFKAVDALITNFHLPRTSLLVLLCAFAGRDCVFGAYQEAIQREYRFFSYGDCMLVQ